MQFTAQIWTSSFVEFEMESDTQPTELEIIEAYEKLQKSDNGHYAHGPQVVYTETIDQTDSHRLQD